MKLNYVENIRNAFRELKAYDNERGGTYELRGVSFRADSPYIFGTPNQKYIEAEIEWYETRDQRVQTLFDIYGKEVEIWKNVATDGYVNSQYGHRIYDRHEGLMSQYQAVYKELWDRPESRQAVMYYVPLHIHTSKNKDHICTTSVQYFINEDNYLEVVVNMRSNDAIFGYANDIAWQKHVQASLCADLSHAHLNIKPGPITWQAGSFHIYRRHYDLII